MFDDAGIWSTLLWISGVVVLSYGVVLWLASVVWVAGDIQRRTDSQIVQVAAIAFAAAFFVPGLILYVALRPSETMEERAERRMEMQALAAQAAESPRCGNCYRTLRDDFVRCPYCAWQMGVTCQGCERMNEASWVVCPYCGADRAAVAPAVAAPAAAMAERSRTGTRRVRGLVSIASEPNRNGHAPMS